MKKDQFFQSVINFINSVHTSTHYLKKDALSDEITPQQNSILEYIFFSTVATTSQVADCLNISLPNASRELKKLLRLKLIVKETDKKDRRKTIINLSVTGQNFILGALERIQKNFWDQSGQLSEDEMKLIISSMTILEKKVFIHS